MTAMRQLGLMLLLLVCAACADAGMSVPTALAPQQPSAVPPTVDFAWACDGPTRTCTFDAEIAPGTNPVTYAEYLFGDGNWRAFFDEPLITHTYDYEGLYRVRLTAYDEVGGVSTLRTKGVYVPISGVPPDSVIFGGYFYRVSGKRHVDLLWANLDGATTYVFRDGEIVATTENDGFYTDVPRRSGTYEYQVCGATNCSIKKIFRVG